MVCQTAAATKGGRRQGAHRRRSRCCLSDRGRARTDGGPWLDSGAGAEHAEVAATAFHTVRPGGELFGTNPLRHVDNRLAIFLETPLRLVHGYPLARLQVVIGKAERIEAKDLASGQRVDAQLQVSL